LKATSRPPNASTVVYGGLEVLGSGHVASHGDDLSAGRLDQSRRLVVCLLVDVGDHHTGAFTRERQGGGTPDACAGSGHEGDLVGEPSVLVWHWGFPFVAAGPEPVTDAGGP
jgi:hypothetical protein